MFVCLFVYVSVTITNVLFSYSDEQNYSEALVDTEATYESVPEPTQPQLQPQTESGSTNARAVFDYQVRRCM